MSRPESALGGTGSPRSYDEAFLRVSGTALVRGLAGAMRSIRLYPIENAVVQNALADLRELSEAIIRSDAEVQLRRSGEFLFVNGARLRLDLDNYAAFSALQGGLRAVGIGTLRWTTTPGAREWTVLLSFLAQSATAGAPHDRFDQLSDRLAQAGILAFELARPEDADASPEANAAKEAAKRTYAQGVSVTRDVMNSVRMGQGMNIGKIKRVVQGLVDQILNNETSLMGLTTIRDYDDYTFTHSVNVCIFSVALGRRLGFTRLQLYDLGLAALFHDIGKSRIPIGLLHKSDVLTDTEWRSLTQHPWLGVLALFQLRDQQEHPYRAMIVAYEHHMKRDLTGYPRSLRTRGLSIFSKIVAVADGFDAATSQRAYQTEPMSPAAVLQEMRDNPRRGMDPVVVKAFVALLGIYPIGTLVVLDSYELAIVHAVNPVDQFLSRPLVRVISDDRGNVLHPGEVVDLAEQSPDGAFRRSIIKTADPDRYGIRIGDYFL
jgi:HD-GYP domain-containing protein (c-di-GMP phosphodiesterase class II)